VSRETVLQHRPGVSEKDREVIPVLRPFWSRIYSGAWLYSVVLFVVFAALRTYATFGPAKARPLFLFQFLLMWLLPFILLTRSGRQEIGICKVSRPAWLLWGPLLGALAAAGAVAVGFALYGYGSDNWIITLRNTYREVAVPMGKWPAIAVLALPAAIVSPVGEEFFFRGLFYFSPKRVTSNGIAACANSFAFASVHLLVHGVSRDAAGLHVRLGSGLMWLLVIMGMAWVLTVCRL
jgi:hypothetical protein